MIRGGKTRTFEILGLVPFPVYLEKLLLGLDILQEGLVHLDHFGLWNVLASSEFLYVSGDNGVFDRAQFPPSPPILSVSISQRRKTPIHFGK